MESIIIISAIILFILGLGYFLILIGESLYDWYQEGKYDREMEKLGECEGDCIHTTPGSSESDPDDFVSAVWMVINDIYEGFKIIISEIPKWSLYLVETVIKWDAKRTNKQIDKKFKYLYESDIDKMKKELGISTNTPTISGTSDVWTTFDKTMKDMDKQFNKTFEDMDKLWDTNFSNDDCDTWDTKMYSRNPPKKP